MKRTYEVPCIKSLDEEQVAESLGPVMLSQTDLVVQQSASSGTAIHSTASVGGGSGGSGSGAVINGPAVHKRDAR
jgi:hypothetical protein